jgi:hypothetical protein
MPRPERGLHGDQHVLVTLLHHQLLSRTLYAQHHQHPCSETMMVLALLTKGQGATEAMGWPVPSPNDLSNALMRGANLQVPRKAMAETHERPSCSLPGMLACQATQA